MILQENEFEIEEGITAVEDSQFEYEILLNNFKLPNSS